MSAAAVADAVTALEDGDVSTAKRLFEESAQRLPALSPRDVQLTCFHLGNIHIRARDFPAAERILRAGLERVPSSEPLAINLGGVLVGLGRDAASVDVLRSAVEANPNSAALYARLGYALGGVERLGEAQLAYARSLALDPNQPTVLNQMGNVMLRVGEAEAAIDGFRRSLALRKHAKTGSNLLLALHYVDGLSPPELFDEHRQWAKTNAAGLPWFEHSQVDRSADRQLRIGYVSPDLYRHSVSYFLGPVLAAQNKSAFQVHCYADVSRPDEVTARLQALSDGWVDATGLSDDALAQRIADDRIDILVDLAGHTARHRLLVFARRPSPIQVTWLGYPDSTGLSSIDYRLTDEFADPVGTERPGEALWRLPAPFLCYEPPEVPAATAPASSSQRPFTFASFNDLAKLSPRCVAAWADVLREAPNAQLLLKSRGLQDPLVAERVSGRFAAHGIAPERLDLRGRTAGLAEHLALYRSVDVGLDTFPYAGTTTTCEALWQAVPVVTLDGDRHAHRVGRSVLKAVGLDELVATDRGAFVKTALALYHDHERLALLKSELRRRIIQSPLADSHRFTRGLEKAFRSMWSRFASNG